MAQSFSPFWLPAFSSPFLPRRSVFPSIPLIPFASNHPVISWDQLASSLGSVPLDPLDETVFLTNGTRPGFSGPETYITKTADGGGLAMTRIASHTDPEGKSRGFWQESRSVYDSTKARQLDQDNDQPAGFRSWLPWTIVPREGIVTPPQRGEIISVEDVTDEMDSTGSGLVGNGTVGTASLPSTDFVLRT